MEVIRVVSVYDKVKENLIEEFELKVPLDILKEIFKVDDDDDPNMYKVYHITETNLPSLVKLIPELGKFNFNNVDLTYECFELN